MKLIKLFFASILMLFVLASPSVLAAAAVAIVKEVSVDGGITYFDVNDAGSAPTTPVDSGDSRITS